MGIRNLNRYLQSNCINSIRNISLSDLSGKVIAVDISIYLYKYETCGMLLENIYLMLGIFHCYNITPIFVFDGKPPAEKRELLQQRRKKRQQAKQEYERLASTTQMTHNHNKIKRGGDNNDTEIDTDLIDELRKNSILITRNKKEQVKELIRAFGETIYDAPGEADQMCAMLVLQKRAWACMSDDMDMFVYGCTRVLRYVSLLNHTAVLYYTKGILRELNLTQEQFTQICVLSGSDYSQQSLSTQGGENITLHIAFQLFYKFYYNEMERNENNHQQCTFYKWLYLKNILNLTQIEELEHICELFNTTITIDHLSNFQIININEKIICQKKIRDIMQMEGFLFL